MRMTRRILTGSFCVNCGYLRESLICNVLFISKFYQVEVLYLYYIVVRIHTNNSDIYLINVVFLLQENALYIVQHALLHMNLFKLRFICVNNNRIIEIHGIRVQLEINTLDQFRKHLK